jgi:gamma-glutamylcyclotransferase (GGCT)/AIG2-like uncharacterized protein YtfP
MIKHLFVYGTLMPGQCRWHALVPWADGGPTPDSVKGELFDTGYGWPAAVIGSGGPIPGFTVPLKAHSLSMALDALDDVEGTNQGLFRRISTTTGELVRAWVYDWAGPTERFAPIDCWECAAMPANSSACAHCRSQGVDRLLSN